MRVKRMGKALYNDNDPYCAQWLRNLIAEGLIPEGDVDERSITELQGSDLDGYTQVHLFAGIGGWAYALRLAGWPDDRPVWTGSCPCQPFSVAGKRQGTKDARHLWPEFYRLIRECHPAICFGEQVASKDGLLWLDGVFVDLEASGYACGAADIAAAGVAAPHIRQRVYWVADAKRRSSEQRRHDLGRTSNAMPAEARKRERLWSDSGHGGADGASIGLAESEGRRFNRRHRATGSNGKKTKNDSGLGFPNHAGLEGFTGDDRDRHKPGRECSDTERPTLPASFWDRYELVRCVEPTASGGEVEKWRRVEPGTFPLAHGVSARVGKLRAYGNPIVPQVAVEFIRAYMDITYCRSMSLTGCRVEKVAHARAGIEAGAYDNQRVVDEAVDKLAESIGSNHE